MGVTVGSGKRTQDLVFNAARMEEKRVCQAEGQGLEADGLIRVKCKVAKTGAPYSISCS